MERLEELKNDFEALRKDKEAKLGGVSVAMMEAVNIIYKLLEDIENGGSLEDATLNSLYYYLRGQYLEEYKKAFKLWGKR